MKIGVISLGCPKNLVDTELVLGKLNASKVEITPDLEEADVILINTCGFIDAAKEESINTILEVAQLKEKGNKKIVVTGCLVERYKKELEKEIPEVDMFIDLKEELLIPEKLGLKPEKNIDLYQNRVITTPPHTAYLKISEGCDHTCAFCAIPSIRGKHRSRSIESIVNEAKALADRGVKELNIVSQDTSFYGIDLYGKPMLWELISQLEKIEDIKWIRLYYLYPTTVNEEFFKRMADSEKVVKYLEMPIQHTEDKILKDMMRGYRKNRIEKILEWKEKYIPEAAIRTAVIVGFPTETEKDFENMKRFIQEAKFDWLGVFTYSHEEGTPAYKQFEDIVPEEEKIRRKNEINLVQEKITEEKNRQLIGKEMEVLIDGFSEEWETLPVGRTYRSAFDIDGITYIETTEPLKPGEFTKIKIKDVVDIVDTVGEVID
ncbi:30S ribosomal protein S12 methylthiotransferase RimO [Persephonella sp. KM09-Lau-8]|uniref:30S ribosomal protein S12 methylthiotransferase RimO n=1 Tax=Persephonella sp. KM09-Lau-8 TaxID=1158345 RepID=UPI0004980AA4|nr:30S ribosomal protein S12 methylthiotransferase RimO [Persephonella sp. KM09-Lau-8]